MAASSARSHVSSGLYGVVGHGIGYSLSPFIFRTAFNSLDWRADYSVIDIEESELPGLLEAMRYAPIRGLSVTKPYKVVVVPFLDRLDESAKIVGAVNTIVKSGRQLVGFNTDVSGVEVALSRFRSKLRNREAVIFGAGGAARAVAYALLSRFRMRTVTIAARRPAQARRLIHDLQDRMPPPVLASGAFRPVGDLQAALANAALVVNATPIGTGHTHAAGLLPRSTGLQAGTLAFDLVYRPRPTPFSIAAHSAGCRTAIDGWPMLVAQADAAFSLWTGKNFPRAVSRKLLNLKKLP